MSPSSRRAIEPLMGWTSSGDMKQQPHPSLRHQGRRRGLLREREGIPYQVIEAEGGPRAGKAAYADNFAFRRGEPWTH